MVRSLKFDKAEAVGSEQTCSDDGDLFYCLGCGLGLCIHELKKYDYKCPDCGLANEFVWGKLIPEEILAEMIEDVD